MAKDWPVNDPHLHRAISDWDVGSLSLTYCLASGSLTSTSCNEQCHRGDVPAREYFIPRLLPRKSRTDSILDCAAASFGSGGNLTVDFFWPRNAVVIVLDFLVQGDGVADFWQWVFLGYLEPAKNRGMLV